MRTITVRAPVNIAVIKYWGKHDEDLIIPINDSISGTLSMEQMSATTSVALNNSFPTNQMWLNGEEVSIVENKRLSRCIELVREMAGDQWPVGHHIRICSRNNFPTAAGLASSAAGYAGLMFALCKLFDINDVTRISTLARLGSGSACRSVYGGFVHWVAGNDMESSIARPIIDENAWPDIRVLVLVVNDNRKETSSTSGMQLSCKTSSLIEHRAQMIVPRRVDQMMAAIHARDFHNFAEITMRDSNQFHAICMDTYPPIRYMNDTSWSVVSFIHHFNQMHNTNVSCYTFDAGPNACIYCLEPYVPQLISLLRLLYSPSNGTDLPLHGISYRPIDSSRVNPKMLNYAEVHKKPDAIKYVISTKLGTGPQILSRQFDVLSLLNSDGIPK